MKCTRINPLIFKIIKSKDKYVGGCMFRWKLVPFCGISQQSLRGINEQNRFWKMKNKNEEKMAQ